MAEIHEMIQHTITRVFDLSTMDIREYVLDYMVSDGEVRAVNTIVETTGSNAFTASLGTNSDDDKFVTSSSWNANGGTLTISGRTLASSAPITFVDGDIIILDVTAIDVGGAMDGKLVVTLDVCYKTDST